MHFVTFPLFFLSPPRQKRGESDEGGVKNGEGKTEKLKMFPVFGGLPRLHFKKNLGEFLKVYKRTFLFAVRKI
jgi:hypothetical protein